MTDRLLIRADASTRIGTGHVMRCIALAQRWQQAGGRAVFSQACSTPAADERLRAEGFEVLPAGGEPGSPEDAAQTSAHAKTLGAAWVVADGYAFGPQWQRQVSQSGSRLLVLDDYGHSESYHADLVLNQNAGAEDALYGRRDPATRLLLGSHYALLRREFAPWRDLDRTFEANATKVLVTLGGSDPDNVTGKVVEALRGIPGIEAVVVVGGSNPHLEAIRSSLGKIPSSIRLSVNPSDMPELMAWAEVAVSAAGSTSWEMAFMGLPAIFIVAADNQRKIAAALDAAHAGVNLGPHYSLTPDAIARALRALLGDAPRRKAMSAGGRRLVDGRGSCRVLAALGAALDITILSEAQSWLDPYLAELRELFEKAGHRVHAVGDPGDIPDGDIAFLFSPGQGVPARVLRRNAHNLLVHESALPAGRGAAPLTWQLLEGKSEIPVCLAEAAEPIDSGPVYSRDLIRFEGHELIDEIRTARARATQWLCGGFVSRYPWISSEGRPQQGEPTFYPERRPDDCRLDPRKTLAEQFNLLRVCDPDRDPAFFELEGHRFEVRIRAASRRDEETSTP